MDPLGGRRDTILKIQLLIYYHLLSQCMNNRNKFYIYRNASIIEICLIFYSIVESLNIQVNFKVCACYISLKEGLYLPMLNCHKN